MNSVKNCEVLITHFNLLLITTFLWPLVLTELNLIKQHAFLFCFVFIKISPCFSVEYCFVFFRFCTSCFFFCLFLACEKLIFRIIFTLFMIYFHNVKSV